MTDEFPTPVGMNHNPEPGALMDMGVPHTRGDEPPAYAPDDELYMSSPHPWG